ncbi:MAG: hypothetical protein LBM08_15275 [Dysgonamonadaceae bacterium]|jgi:hypothetical protein|nr:hypothetical protein [Dysgonamonadaceae bacterium]
MPYRRLPNTDEARIRALEKAIQTGNSQSVLQQIVPFEILSEARTLLSRFRDAQNVYQQTLKAQTQSNKKYQVLVKNAKLYLSHFIQVFNLAVIRREIKEELKELYGLNPKDYSTPDMLSDNALLSWGEKIIKGENERIQKGGAPIYNPTIAKVKVHYDLFKEAFHAQKMHQKNTSRSLKALNEMRAPADKIILDVWNATEESFKNLSGEARLNKCREFGVMYYYRKGESAQ